MQNRDTFSGYNPIINFVFFIGAVIFGMFFIHPGFLLCSFILAFAYYITVNGVKGFKLLSGMIVLFIVLSAISPLFNTYGDHVLFTYFGGRHYTLEALYYGMAISAMFVTVITWFASYNSVMTSDKFLYIFGRTAPSVSLVLSMIMRLIPGFKRKVDQIASARKCVGKAGEFGTKKERIRNGMTIVSTLTTWALEGGIITADSMRSRGYGSGRRSSFAVYRFDSRDILLLIVMIILMTEITFCGIMGGAGVTYTPTLYITGADNIYTIAGMAGYFVFLAIPTTLNITEAITWHILKSRI